MGINISIVAAPDAASSSVSATGSVQHIISDEERGTFKLLDGQLKDAVNAYFGKRPNDAYLHSPTPWGDLYKTYGWKEVQTVLVPTRATILGITSEPVIVKTQTFVNDSSHTGTFNVSISEQVSNTTTSNWSTGGTLTVGQKFTYGSSSWGQAREVKPPFPTASPGALAVRNPKPYCWARRPE